MNHTIAIEKPYLFYEQTDIHKLYIMETDLTVSKI